jgi:hypothetical protein
MSVKRRRDRDSNMGFGLNVKGESSRNPFGFRKRPAKKKSAAAKPKEAPLMGTDETPIQFPMNFYPPNGAESLDIRRLINVPAGQVTELLILSFTADKSQAVTFYKYGIFTDALDASLIQFIPRINNKRILRYHGDPQDDFKLNLSLGPNLNESNMIPTQLYLKPGDTITWHVLNLDVVINPMGVRMTGYIDLTKRRKTMSFGG